MKRSTRSIKRRSHSKMSAISSLGQLTSLPMNFHRSFPTSAVSAAIIVIVKELENACEPSFTAMSRIAWTTVNLVSGQSPYVDDLALAIEQVVDTVKPLVEQKKYVRNFFDKAARCV